MRTHFITLLVLGLAGQFATLPAEGQIPRLPHELRDTLVIEEVLRQHEVVDSAQRVAEEAFRQTSLDIRNAFEGMARAESRHRTAMERWLSNPSEESEVAYTEAAARSINASVRYLDPIIGLRDNLRNRLRPVRRFLQSNIRTISKRLATTSRFTTSIQAVTTEHDAAYDRLAFKLVQTGEIERLDQLSLPEKADLLGMETTGQLLTFVGTTMTRHEVQLRASRERLRRYIESLDNSTVLAGTVSEQAAALQGAFQTVAYTFGQQLQMRDVEQAFEGVLELEEGLQGAAVSLLEQGLTLAQFTVPDASAERGRVVQPLNMRTLADRIRTRATTVARGRIREN